ncbi:MAG TPA: trypsin-like peptidase domain-containing protein, partial [Gemmatimonadales bacterium]|nr:trypsin-like peptidase domain-containing protein [Gemmatimonadales bacterium]
ASTTSAAPANAAATGGNLSVQEIYRQDAPGVVQITGSRGPLVATGARTSEELGSGFVIDKAGHIVTSNYVIGGAQHVKISFSGTSELDATVVGQDPSTDVAVLQVDAHSRSLWPLPLGDSDQVQVGDPVVAIGNTLILDRTATVGVVSAVQRGIDAPSGAPAAADAIQTDANINHGNSGGPLINTRGQVIGVTSRLGVGGVGDNGRTGFAIPIDIVKSVVAQLIETGRVVHPYLGIDALPVSGSLARSFDLPSDYGLIVQSVTQGSAAEGAGLRAGATPVTVAGESYRIGGDIIIAADGVPVTGAAQLREAIQTLRPGDRLTLEIWRGRTKETVGVTLGSAPG